MTKTKSERFKAAKRASIIGILGNIFLLIIKALIGFTTKSQSMIADAFNSAGDIFSSIMTYVGNRIANKPQDDDHNLGHGKAEYIFSLLISISMIVISLFLCKESIKSLINPSGFLFSKWLIVVSLVTILTKFCMYLYTHRISKKFNNLLVEANAKDHINDCFVTTFTFISAICALKNILWFDGVTGIGISLWICFVGGKIFKESYDVLMDKAIDEKSKEKVMKIIENYPEIKKIQHFNSTPVGYKYQISFTIFVDGNFSTFESHNIADKLEKEIDEKVEEVYLTVIHVNPY